MRPSSVGRPPENQSATRSSANPSVALVRTPRLVRRITNLLQRAIHALWLPSHTDLPPMMNQLMRECDPTIRRNDLHQIPLHLLGTSLASQLQPPRQPHHVRIDDHPVGNPIPRPQHNIPRLPR